MSLLDTLQDGLKKILPEKKHGSGPTALSGMANDGHRMVPFDDDMIVPKPVIVFHAGQVFFNFLAMCCFASVASFQAHWKVGPSGLSGLAIFLTVSGIFLSLFMVVIPVIYEKYDKFNTLARALKEQRVSFILTGTGSVLSLLIAFIVTISAWTQPGCKDASKDPNAKAGGKEFVRELPGWCNTKKAGAVFLWLAFAFWAGSCVYLILQWRKGGHPRDPPFRHPTSGHTGHEDELEEGDEESTYHQIPPARRQTSETPSSATGNPFSDTNRYSSAPSTAGGGYSAPAASRPSMDAYGAFSDPAPSGFAAPSGFTPSPGFASTPPPDEAPRVSRTMQYADPYAAVRAQIGGATSPSRESVPPSYEPYQGYR